MRFSSGSVLVVALACGACASTTDGPDKASSPPVDKKAEAAPAEDKYEFIRISERAFSFRSAGHMNLVLNTSEGWVVMDPMNEGAAAALAKVLKAEAPDKPLALIAYSHYHQDHAGGARPLLDAFGEDVTIVANRATPPLYAGKKWAKPIVEPTELIDPPWSKTIGDLTFELRSLGPNHSSDMVIAWIPEEKLVYLVDFIGNEHVGYKDLPGVHLPGYWESQRAVLDLPFEHVAYGHGRPAGRQAVVEHIEYWDKLRTKAQEALAAGWTEDEAAERIKLDEYKGWSMYAEWGPGNVRAMYRYEKSLKE
jgi:glyoxylase-like metal-dependent hydrolase (beta-lactamase superfamily II)